jgi:hypothetical protein
MSALLGNLTSKDSNTTKALHRFFQKDKCQQEKKILFNNFEARRSKLGEA